MPGMLSQRSLLGPRSALPGVPVQAWMDNAPVGSVGAPGGLLEAPPAVDTRGGALSPWVEGLAGFNPVIGAGMDLGDIWKGATERDPWRFGLGMGSLFLPEVAEKLVGGIGPALREAGQRFSELGSDPRGWLEAMTVWQGSPHLKAAEEGAPLGRFRDEFIGTGEGVTAYGHGHYVAESPEVAKTYRLSNQGSVHLGADEALNQDQLEHAARILDKALGVGQFRDPYANESGKQWLGDMLDKYGDVLETKLSGEDLSDLYNMAPDPGYLYKVDLPDEHIEKMLDWDKSITDQPYIMEALADYIGDSKTLQYMNGKYLVRTLEGYMGPQKTSEFLLAHGIPGTKYFDAMGGGRRTGEGTRNFVVFDPTLLTVLERFQ